jgi:uncharacterized protein YidB (DUF937 family)
MGLFDEIVKNVGGQMSNDEQKNMLNLVMGLVRDPKVGGLSGLVNSFTKKGFGDLVSSWVGTGENKAVTETQIEEVLGQDKIEQIAKETGTSTTSVNNGLASFLPQIIDKLTPEGKVTEGGLLDQGVDMLKKSLFK